MPVTIRCCTLDTYALGFDLYCRRIEADKPELAEFFRKNPDCHELCPTLVENPPPGVFSCFAMGAETEMRTLGAQLEQLWPEDLYIHVLRSPRYVGYMCEIAPAGVTSGAASSTWRTIGESLTKKSVPWETM